MGSTDNFLPGTVVSVESAAATVPDVELEEVAKAAAAGDAPYKSEKLSTDKRHSD